MSPVDILLLGVIFVLVALAARYVYKAKKSGSPCIGCDAGKGCCHCCSTAQNKKETQDPNPRRQNLRGFFVPNHFLSCCIPWA